MDDIKQKQIIKYIQKKFEGLLLVIFGIVIYGFSYTSIRINYQYQILDIFYFLSIVLIILFVDKITEDINIKIENIIKSLDDDKK